MNTNEYLLADNPVQALRQRAQGLKARLEGLDLQTQRMGAMLLLDFEKLVFQRRYGQAALALEIIERVIPTARLGSIEVVCGPMGCGKTTELIRRVGRAQRSRQKSLIFRPAKDTRGDPNRVTSRDGQWLPAATVETPWQIWQVFQAANDVRVVAVDEVQFLGISICHLALALERRGGRVILAGLNYDFRGEPFGPILWLQSLGLVTRLTAVCEECGAPATHTQRLIDGQPASYYDPVELVGDIGGEAKETYHPVCRRCLRVPDRPDIENLLELASTRLELPEIPFPWDDGWMAKVIANQP